MHCVMFACLLNQLTVQKHHRVLKLRYRPWRHRQTSYIMQTAFYNHSRQAFRKKTRRKRASISPSLRGELWFLYEEQRVPTTNNGACITIDMNLLCEAHFVLSAVQKVSELFYVKTIFANKKTIIYTSLVLHGDGVSGRQQDVSQLAVSNFPYADPKYFLGERGCKLWVELSQ